MILPSDLSSSLRHSFVPFLSPSHLLGAQKKPDDVPQSSIDERKLFAESHNPFVHLQRKLLTAKTTDQYYSLIYDAWRQYQSIATSRYHELGKHKRQSDDDTRSTLYRSLAMILHIGEIFFLVSPEELAAPYLTEWFSLHLGDAVSRLEWQRLAQLPRPETDPSYWDHVYKFAVNGLVDRVQALLSLHSRWRHLRSNADGEADDIFSTVVRQRDLHNDEDKLLSLLETMLSNLPRPNSLMTDEQFQDNFDDWKQQVLETVECNRAIRDWDEVAKLLRLMTGDADLIHEKCSNWRDSLIAHLTYVNPLVRLEEVKGIVDQYLADYAQDAEADGDVVANEIIKSAIAVDVRGFVLNISGLHSLWLAAHVIDLLFHAGWLEDDETLRANTLTDYAHNLVRAGGFDAIALSYLVHGISNPTVRESEISRVILGMPLSSERDATRVLEYCYQYAIAGEPVKTIHRNMAKLHFDNKNFASALAWHIRGGLRVEDNTLQTLVAAVTDALSLPGIISKIGTTSPPKEVSEIGHSLVAVAAVIVEAKVEFPLDLEAVPADASSVNHFDMTHAVFLRNAVVGISCVELAFLAQYAKAVRFAGVGEFHKAAKLLVLLLKAGLAPRRSWPSLIADVILLCRREGIALSIVEVQTLMRCFDDVRASQVPQVQSALKSMSAKGFSVGDFSLLFSQMLAQAVAL